MHARTVCSGFDIVLYHHHQGRPIILRKWLFHVFRPNEFLRSYTKVFRWGFFILLIFKFYSHSSKNLTNVKTSCRIICTNLHIWLICIYLWMENNKWRLWTHNTKHTFVFWLTLHFPIHKSLVTSKDSLYVLFRVYTVFKHCLLSRAN